MTTYCVVMIWHYYFLQSGALDSGLDPWVKERLHLLDIFYNQNGSHAIPMQRGMVFTKIIILYNYKLGRM